MSCAFSVLYSMLLVLEGQAALLGSGSGSNLCIASGFWEDLTASPPQARAATPPDVQAGHTRRCQALRKPSKCCCMYATDTCSPALETLSKWQQEPGLREAAGEGSSAVAPGASGRPDMGASATAPSANLAGQPGDDSIPFTSNGNLPSLSQYAPAHAPVFTLQV